MKTKPSKRVSFDEMAKCRKLSDWGKDKDESECKEESSREEQAEV